MRLPLLSWPALASFTLSALAQTNTPPIHPISLQECMDLALKHNLDVQIERFNPEIARLNLGGAYGAYDPEFSVSAREEYVDQPGEVDPKKSGLDYPYQLKTETVEPSLSGRLPTGLTYDLGASFNNVNGLTDFTSNPKDAELFPPLGLRQTNEYVAFTGITLRQPLLKDFWIDSTRQRIWVNKKTLKISELAVRYQIMNVLTKVQLAYFDLVFAREGLKVQETALALARQLLSETRRRVEVGDLPPLESTQAESQVESAQANVIAAQDALSQAADALKNLVTDDFKTWADTALEPTDPLVPTVVALDRSQSWQNALSARPDYLQAKLDLERRDILVRYDFNQLFPSLDVIGSYGVRASQNSFEAAASDLRDLSHPSYSYGVVFSVPLGNQTARNRYKATRAERQQALLQFKKLEQDILVQIDIAVKSAQSYFKRLNATRAARVFAEAALEAEQKKFANGLSTSFLVLEYQQRLTDARSVELRVLADYRKSLAQLSLAEGSTLEKNHVSVGLR
jgi:HAE1 family hydrophobic/amphiphilic exporter-1